MTISETFRQRLDDFSESMELSPNRDRAIYSLVHAGLVLIGAVFVFVGYTMAVCPVVVLTLVLSGRDPWQIHLSRRCALAGLIVLALCIIALLVSLAFVEPVGLWGIIWAGATFLLVTASLALWYWAANRLHNAHFRLPPEDSGPW